MAAPSSASFDALGDPTDGCRRRLLFVPGSAPPTACEAVRVVRAACQNGRSNPDLRNAAFRLSLQREG